MAKLSGLQPLTRQTYLQSVPPVFLRLFMMDMEYTPGRIAETIAPAFSPRSPVAKDPMRFLALFSFLLSR
jgi:hypothetical protein